MEIQNKYGFCNFRNDYKDLIFVGDYFESSEVVRTMGVRNFTSYMNDQARRKLYDYDDPIGNRGAKTLKIFNSLKLLNHQIDFLR